MNYITEKEFFSRYPIYDVKGSTIDLRTAIIDAKSIIDSYLKGKFYIYTHGKTEEHVPVLLKRIAADLTCYYLQIRNLQATDEDNVHQLYKQSVAMLTKIREGEIGIDLDDISKSPVVIVSTAGKFEYRE